MPSLENSMRGIIIEVKGHVLEGPCHRTTAE